MGFEIFGSLNWSRDVRERVRLILFKVMLTYWLARQPKTAFGNGLQLCKRKQVRIMNDNVSNLWFLYLQETKKIRLRP